MITNLSLLVNRKKLILISEEKYGKTFHLIDSANVKVKKYNVF